MRCAGKASGWLGGPGTSGLGAVVGSSKLEIEEANG